VGALNENEAYKLAILFDEQARDERKRHKEQQGKTGGGSGFSDGKFEQDFEFGNDDPYVGIDDPDED
jgi:hypothetical protein